MANDEIEVRWQVEDGYVGSRPQRSFIPVSEFEDDMTEETIRQTVEEYIQEEFEQKISFSIDNLDEIVAEGLEVVRQLREEEEEKYGD